MKKVTLFLFVAILFAACTKEVQNLSSKQENLHEIRFEIPRSRATVEATDFEKQIKTLEILIFNKDHQKVISRTVLEDEIASGSFSVGVSKKMAGEKCTVYAIANSPQDESQSEEEIQSRIEEDFDMYQSNYDMVKNRAIRPRGFSMSDKKEVTLSLEGGVTSVTLSLRRVVARIHSSISISEKFSKKYPGKITPKSVKILGCATKSYIVQGDSVVAAPLTASYTQPSKLEDLVWHNLYYSYERNDQTSATLPRLIVNCEYDNDGNADTKNDISQMEYVIDLNASGIGVIKRNTSYAVEAQITGLQGQELSFTVSVLDWDEATHEEIEIGA
ncbi:MAG: FimB/Mfa2 family fimbrial subunit [Alistipes sp.]|nr:FimB/Mfa2 family fimbrial subunit [Candidatus Alistipes equi]